MPLRKATNTLLPHYRPDTRTLWFEGQVVKEFRVPAVNQVLILEAFQELGWPEWIDDPLPPCSDIDPKVRLHDAIKRLNRNQRNPLLKFHGDGTGKRIGWSAR
jgi:hypothetical protein